MSAIVVANNAKKSFEHMGRTLDVLRGIDLSIDEGEIVGIVGQSGAGKSTLLHCIGTLDVPSGGSLKVAGEEVTAMSSARLADLRNRTIGFVFQFHHLLPEFNALENVMMPGLIQGQGKKELAAKAEALLDEVGLKDRINHRPGELSGGEQQRVALARALVLEPKLILADEPTGNLDSRTSEQIHKLFFDINKNRGTTLVIVTHNTQLAARMPRVVTLRDGRVEKDVRRAPEELERNLGSGLVGGDVELDGSARSSDKTPSDDDSATSEREAESSKADPEAESAAP